MRPTAPFVLAATILLLTAAAWAPAVGYGSFALDDDVYVFANRHVQTLGIETLRWAFTEPYAANWNPLAWLSHAVDWALWGAWPGGHHLSSAVVHGFAAAAVVPLARRIALMSGLTPGRALAAAAIAALVFALHPLQAEAVVWLAQRKTLLSGAFCLVAAHQWLVWIEERRRANLAWALAAFAAALLAKASAVALPVVLAALAWHFAAKTWRNWLPALAPFVLLATAVAGFTVWVNLAGNAVAAQEDIPRSAALWGAVRALGHYALVLLWPPAAAPVHPLADAIGRMDGELLLGIALPVAVAALAWRRPWLRTAALCFVALLAPVLVVRVGLPIFAAERYLYLAVLAAALPAAIAAARLSLPKAAWAVAGLALLGLQQQALAGWRDEAVWGRAARVWPDSCLVRALQSAHALLPAGQAEAALAAADALPDPAERDLLRAYVAGRNALDRGDGAAGRRAFLEAAALIRTRADDAQPPAPTWHACLAVLTPDLGTAFDFLARRNGREAALLHAAAMMQVLAAKPRQGAGMLRQLAGQGWVAPETRVDSLIWLGIAYYRLRDRTEMLAAFDTAAALVPGDPRPERHRRRLLEKLGG